MQNLEVAILTSGDREKNKKKQTTNTYLCRFTGSKRSIEMATGIFLKKKKIKSVGWIKNYFFSGKYIFKVWSAIH